MLRRLVILMFAIVLARPAALFAGASDTAVSDHDRIVVMISLDGLAGYYLDDPKAQMPTIRELANEGARAASMRVSTPSVTWPNHTTLVTGVPPAIHGVVGNNYYDRQTQKRVTLIGDPVFNEDQIVKVPTLYDVAKAAGLRTAAIRWPATRGAKSIDWIVPAVHTARLLEDFSTHALIQEATESGIWYAPPSTTQDTTITADGDHNSTSMFNLILHRHRPQFALLHLANVDHTEHQFGPKTPKAYAAIKDADNSVRLVWDQLKRDYPDQATLIITSDHGFSPIHFAIFPNIILRNAGLEEIKDGKRVGGSVYVLPQGGCAMIYILDEANRQSIVDRVKEAFAGAKGIEKVVDPDHLKDWGVANPTDDPHAPDMLLFADEGGTFGDTAAGALSFVEKPELRGTHGHDVNLPDLHGTFVAVGDGIKPGVKLGEIQNTSVAPTIAKLLGVKLPNLQSKPLDEILAP